MKTAVQFGIIVVALGIAAYMVVSTFGPQSSGRDQGWGDIRVQVVSAEQVLEDYKQYATTPDAGLKTLWFVVHGEVKEIIRPQGANYATVVLSTGPSEIGVACLMRNPADAAQVKVGQEVGIAGRGAPGAMGNIPMNDCTVLPESEWKDKSHTTIHVPAPSPTGG